jgi:carbonic anhydrase
MPRLVAFLALLAVACPHGATVSDWGYAGKVGPTSWASLRPDYALCGSGKAQSPIDISDAGVAAALPLIQLHYLMTRVRVVDSGTGFSLLPVNAGTFEVDGKSYRLTRIDLHQPAEHTIGGKAFALEVQLVHQADDGSTAIIAVVYDVGQRLAALDPYLRALPPAPGEETSPGALLDPTALLPVERGYYTYAGSLTTPPCTEAVTWYVLEVPATISAGQLGTLTARYPSNARPLQDRSRRTIMQRPELF